MSKTLTQASTDHFDMQLSKERKSIQQCQESRAISSCLACSLVIGCASRHAYVKAVYESMSKGAKGGFEF